MNLTSDEWEILLRVVDDWIIEAIKGWKVGASAISGGSGVTSGGLAYDETIDSVQSLLTKLARLRESAAEAGVDRDTH